MTVLEISQARSGSDVGLSLSFRTNLFLGTLELGRDILQCLIEADNVFLPEYFDGGELTRGRNLPFNPQDLSSH